MKGRKKTNFHSLYSPKEARSKENPEILEKVCIAKRVIEDRERGSIPF